MAKSEFELIMVVVNQGFSDNVMEAARLAGARGGTVLNARGTARQDAEKLFDIAIHPEKELVFILAHESVKDEILHNIYKDVGLFTEGQGIAFSVPVDDVVGINGTKAPKKKKSKETLVEELVEEVKEELKEEENKNEK